MVTIHVGRAVFRHPSTLSRVQHVRGSSGQSLPPAQADLWETLNEAFAHLRAVLTVNQGNEEAFRNAAQLFGEYRKTILALGPSQLKHYLRLNDGQEFEERILGHILVSRQRTNMKAG